MIPTSFHVQSHPPLAPHVAVIASCQRQFWTRSRVCRNTITIPQMARDLRNQYGKDTMVYYTLQDGSRMILQ